MRYLTHFLPVYDYAGSWNLKGKDDVCFERVAVPVCCQVAINVQDKGTVTLGGEGELSPDLSL